MFRLNTEAIVTALIFLFILILLIRNLFKLKTITLIPVTYIIGRTVYDSFFNNSLINRKNAEESLLDILLIILIAIFISKDFKKNFKYSIITITFVSFVSSIFLILNKTFGLFDVHTFETSIYALSIALIFAFVGKYGQFRIQVETILAFFLLVISLIYGGGTAYFMLFILVFKYVFKHMRQPLSYLVFITSSFLLGLLFKNKILSGSGRYELWSRHLDYWNNNFNMLIGSGVGSYSNLAMNQKVLYADFAYAHNDFLQTYLETGLLGLLSMLIILAVLFKKACKTNDRYIVLIVAAFMFNYFPLQLLFTKVMILLVFILIENEYNKRLDAA